MDRGGRLRREGMAARIEGNVYSGCGEALGDLEEPLDEQGLAAAEENLLELRRDERVCDGQQALGGEMARRAPPRLRVTVNAAERAGVGDIPGGYLWPRRAPPRHASRPVRATR